MRQIRQGAKRWLVAAVMLALPVILLASAIRSLRELPETAGAYLRARAVTLATRLEHLPSAEVGDQFFEMLAAEEPALVDLRIYRPPGEETDHKILGQLWRGEALFHTEEVTVDGEPIFRAYLPFHADQEMRIARIDLAADAAGYLVEHTRHHLLLSLLASLALACFTAYFLWQDRRARALQRRQLELEHLAQLGRLSAVLAHEIRNPLGTIKGFVQLAREQATQAAGDLLVPVLDETARLERLVNDLLLYGRPKTPDFREISWPDLAARMEAHARELIGASPVRFDCSGNLDGLRSDPEMLEQLLLNLLRNAIEAVHGKPDGEVKLAAAARRGSVSIQVEDNGPGLPEEIRERLYEPFTTTKSNGTGLGLPIVRNLATVLGGMVEITRRPGGGTLARLILPT